MKDRSSIVLNVGFSLGYGALMLAMMLASMDWAPNIERHIFRFALLPAFLVGVAMIVASHRMDR